MSKKNITMRYPGDSVFKERFNNEEGSNTVRLSFEKSDHESFDSKSEVNAYINKNNKFCPLIAGKCRHDCVCYSGNSIIKVRDKYRVRVGKCTNGIFK